MIYGQGKESVVYLLRIQKVFYTYKKKNKRNYDFEINYKNEFSLMKSKIWKYSIVKYAKEFVMHTEKNNNQ